MGDICCLLARAGTAAGCDATTATNVCAATATIASNRYLSIRFLYVELAFWQFELFSIACLLQDLKQ